MFLPQLLVLIIKCSCPKLLVPDNYAVTCSDHNKKHFSRSKRRFDLPALLQFHFVVMKSVFNQPIRNFLYQTRALIHFSK